MSFILPTENLSLSLYGDILQFSRRKGLVVATEKEILKTIMLNHMKLYPNVGKSETAIKKDIVLKHKETLKPARAMGKYEMERVAREAALKTDNEILVEIIEEYARLNKLPLISPAVCLRITNGLVEDILNECLFWTERSNYFEPLVNQYIPWCFEGTFKMDSEEGKVAQDFFTDVLDYHILRLNLIIFSKIGEPDSDAMWMVWTTNKVGHDIALIKERDYRIIEFERLVNEGTIKVPVKGKHICKEQKNT